MHHPLAAPANNSSPSHHNSSSSSNNNNTIEAKKQQLLDFTAGMASALAAGAGGGSHASNTPSSGAGTPPGLSTIGAGGATYVGGTRIKPDLDDDLSENGASPPTLGRAGPSSSSSGNSRLQPSSSLGGAGSSSRSTDPSEAASTITGPDGDTAFLNSDETAQYEADKRLIYKYVVK